MSVKEKLRNLVEVAKEACRKMIKEVRHGFTQVVWFVRQDPITAITMAGIVFTGMERMSVVAARMRRVSIEERNSRTWEREVNRGRQ